MKEIQVQWLKAHSAGDYEKMGQIGKDLRLLLGLGNQVLSLKRRLQDCLAKEDFDTAIEIRNELKRHEATRDNFDGIYLTSRFDQLMVMEEPSEQMKVKMA